MSRIFIRKKSLVSNKMDTGIFRVVGNLKLLIQNQIKRYLRNLLPVKSPQNEFLFTNFQVNNHRLTGLVLLGLTKSNLHDKPVKDIAQKAGITYNRNTTTQNPNLRKVYACVKLFRVHLNNLTNLNLGT